MSARVPKSDHAHQQHGQGSLTARHSQQDSSSVVSAQRPPAGAASQHAKRTDANEQPPRDNTPKLPMTPAAALKAHMSKMSLFEQGEILDYPEVYFVALNAQKVCFICKKLFEEWLV